MGPRLPDQREERGERASSAPGRVLVSTTVSASAGHYYLGLSHPDTRRPRPGAPWIECRQEEAPKGDAVCRGLLRDGDCLWRAADARGPGNRSE